MKNKKELINEILKYDKTLIAKSLTSEFPNYTCCSEVKPDEIMDFLNMFELYELADVLSYLKFIESHFLIVKPI